MTKNFRKFLLSELRMAVYQPGDPAELTDELLCKAVTLNENLQNLGYILRPEDLVRLAVSPSLDGFYTDLKALVPDVKADPMYPGFPQQVMKMSTAEFRLHQMLHYFSTYGLENLLGEKVRRGWLPDYDGPKRTENDTRLLESRVIELVDESDAAFSALRILLGRRERLTNPELELVLESVGACRVEQIQGLKVRFKENIDLLFPGLMAATERESALKALRMICQHTGDVLRCAESYIRTRRFHLHTGEKKLLVKLLESYPVWNLRENLMKSRKVREHSLMVLNYVDYNRFSRSPEHREAVRALRNGELLSWHSIGEALLRKRDPRALNHFAERPGYMVRMLNRMLSLGYGEDAIVDALLPHAETLSAHLLVHTMHGLGGRTVHAEETYKRKKQELSLELSMRLDKHDFLETRLNHALEIAVCKNHFNDEMRALDPARRRVNRLNTCRQKKQQMREAEYSRLITEPEERARREAYETCQSLYAEIAALRGKLEECEHYLQKQRDLKPGCVLRNADHAIDPQRVRYLFPSEESDESESVLRGKLSFLRGSLEREKRLASERLARMKREIEAKNGILYRIRCEELDRWELEELAQIELDFEQGKQTFEEDKRRLEAQYDAQLRELNASMAEALADVERRYDFFRAEFKRKEELLDSAYEDALRMSRYDPTSVRILKRLLQEHFRQVTTPLKGKKVYCKFDEFDLCHSTLETENRSKDGGYIRSGIAYRIPENAKTVRFFVYWNDSERIDIDLHGWGHTLEGEDLHVGWNADFKNNSVVHSGDITHSDAAEYIDIDLSAPIDEICANVHLFSGKSCFRYVETCYVGLMAVDKLGQTIKHYDPANCFFTHELTQRTQSLHYGYIDVQNRFVRFVGQPDASDWCEKPDSPLNVELFSLQDYLDYVLDGQNAILVKNEEDADIVLTMGKSLSDHGVSLVDSNFFLEC